MPDAVIAGAKASGMSIALDRIFGADLVQAASSHDSSPPRPGRPAASIDAGAGHRRVASAG
jgi:hypothetical protein